MAPHRTQRQRSRPLTKLESIVLPRYASHHARIWAELAYTVDERLRNTVGTTTTLDEQLVVIGFREFMDRLNERGVSTGLGKRTTEHKTARQLLQDAADNGYVELHYHDGPPPRQINTIVVLPTARDKLTGFLPRMRGFDNLPERVIYQGALALAKRNFFPNGCRQPTKEQFAERNIEKYIKLQLYKRKPLARTLSAQDANQVSSFTALLESEHVVGTQGPEPLSDCGVHQPMDVEPREILETDSLNTREVDMGAHASVSDVTPVTPRVLQPINWVCSGIMNLWYATPESLPRRTARIVPETPSTPSPVSQVEDVVDNGSSVDTRNIPIPGEYEEASEVGALFQQTAAFEGCLAALDGLYKAAIEASAFAKAKTRFGRKLAEAERDLESLRRDLTNSNERAMELTRQRDDKASEIERLRAEIERMGERIRALESTLQLLIGTAQAALG